MVLYCALSQRWSRTAALWHCLWHSGCEEYSSLVYRLLHILVMDVGVELISISVGRSFFLLTDLTFDQNCLFDLSFCKAMAR